ncbi:hypothetical protein VTG60DRAFT_4796 [Thermothelomyces hinnuleus]
MDGRDDPLSVQNALHRHRLESRKRPRSTSPTDGSLDTDRSLNLRVGRKPHSHHNHQSGPRILRRDSRSGGDDDDDDDDDVRTKPQLVVLHRVECRAQHSSPGHRTHDETCLFLDRPGLFPGDSRASALRGRQPVHAAATPDEYLDRVPGVGLVVERTYDCEAYHRRIGHSFVRLPLPAGDASSGNRLPAELWPYFDVLLPENEERSGMPLEPAEAKTETICTSQPLRDAMDVLAERVPSLFAQWDAGLVPPYSQLYRNRVRMRELVGEVLDGRLAAHALLLLDYVEETFGTRYREADALFARGLVERSYLDMLFGPNEVVVCEEDGEPVAYMSTPPPPRTAPDRSHVIIACYTWAFDGAFRREHRNIQVHWPPEAKDGTVPISKLNAYPLRLDPTGHLEVRLRDRGTMLWRCRKRNLVGYAAPTGPFEMQVPNPRYMIDMATYKELHAKEQQYGAAESRDDLGKEAIESDTPPQDPFVLLLPPKILGYGLHDKKWRSLLVRHLRPVRWNKKAFEQLVLDPRKKELIEAMVRIHVSSEMSTDVVEGKGNGLIILLHGGPGTGKTLTAESIAELAERPLYRVTCGDIGTDPEGVERYLESVLYIGSLWKAVVLLDESDVFLEQREKTDLQRNALVSVFLRVLEYYDGILILTSNRVGTFDEAFKSRVQLALHYPPLSEEDRWKVWDNFISELEEQQERQRQRQQQQQQRQAGAERKTDRPDSEDKNDDDDAAAMTTRLADGEVVNVKELRGKINVLAREKINGRQIRNAITTARQLAMHRHQPMGYAHLSQAILVAREFEDYVTKTQGHDAGDYVRAEGLRLE